MAQAQQAMSPEAFIGWITESFAKEFGGTARAAVDRIEVLESEVSLIDAGVETLRRQRAAKVNEIAAVNDALGSPSTKAEAPNVGGDTPRPKRRKRGSTGRTNLPYRPRPEALGGGLWGPTNMVRAVFADAGDGATMSAPEIWAATARRFGEPQPTTSKDACLNALHKPNSSRDGNKTAELRCVYVDGVKYYSLL